MKTSRRGWRPPIRPMLSAALVAFGGLVALASMTLPDPARAQVAVDPPPTPQTLKGVPRPEPANLGDFVANRAEAIALGKALFWDVQVGSDGKTACASCHFHAGADNRSKNQISPGLARMSTTTQPNPDTTFQLGGPNKQLDASNFPLHALSDPSNSASTRLRSVNDPVTSAGVFNERFGSISMALKVGGTIATPTAGAMPTDPYANWYAGTTEVRSSVPDPVFHVGAYNTRRIEPRNTPTVINAVFNLRNFWDGRAEWVFNGVNPFGLRDTGARVWKNTAGTMSAVGVRLENSSLASQASGPPLSDFEMSAAGRGFPDLGRRLLYVRPLQQQWVSGADSVLGGRADTVNRGLREANYAAMVQRAFRPEWWNGTSLIEVGAAGATRLVPVNNTPAPNQYSHMQYNFSLFFGLALQMYQATLVSDDAPFDRYLTGRSSAMSATAAQGMGVFFGKGRCAECHGGAELTNASIARTKPNLLSRMIMGDGGQAVYDEGYYNIGVRPTLDDLGVGAKDPFGNPLSWSAVAQQGINRVNELLGFPANLTVAAAERTARFGAFKTPTVRNVELTAPYFHNGDSLTLWQVVEFYNRGGNFAVENRPELDAEIKPLGLTLDERVALVEFLKALTDDRVRYHRAPFDHPELAVTDGHIGDTVTVTPVAAGTAADVVRVLPAVGAAGYGAAQVPPNFLSTSYSDQAVYELRTNAGQCVAPFWGALTISLTSLRQESCAGRSYQRYRVVVGDEGSVLLVNQLNGMRVDAWFSASLSGGQVYVNSPRDSTDQHWRLEDVGGGDVRIRNRVGQCLYMSASLLDNNVRIQGCSTAEARQRFKLVRVAA